jgi:hypothetical protein
VGRSGAAYVRVAEPVDQASSLARVAPLLSSSLRFFLVVVVGVLRTRLLAKICAFFAPSRAMGTRSPLPLNNRTLERGGGVVGGVVRPCGSIGGVLFWIGQILVELFGKGYCPLKTEKLKGNREYRTRTRTRTRNAE